MGHGRLVKAGQGGLVSREVANQRRNDARHAVEEGNIQERAARAQ
jgi:hypothetical protein